MGAILTPALLAQRHIEAAAIEANGVPGYRPRHHTDGGECASDLSGLPVLLKYELTADGVEVTEIGINGHAVPAGYFDADTVQCWAGDCQRSRVAAGWRTL